MAAPDPARVRELAEQLRASGASGEGSATGSVGVRLTERRDRA